MVLLNAICYYVTKIPSFYFTDRVRTEDDSHLKIPSDVQRVSKDVQFGVKVSVKSKLRVPMIFFFFLRRTLSYGKSARTMS